MKVLIRKKKPAKKSPPKKKRRRRKNPNKGGNWERTFSKFLSLWWSNGKRDDVFWRSQTSGGRATQRKKSGQDTFGQYGDIAAVHPKGRPLLEVICFELKNGYHTTHAINVVDSPGNNEKQFTEWVTKAHRDAERSGSFSWALVHQRKGRCPVVYFPARLWSLLNLQNEVFSSDLSLSSEFYPERIFCVRMDEFFQAVTPERVRKQRKRIK